MIETAKADFSGLVRTIQSYFLIGKPISLLVLFPNNFANVLLHYRASDDLNGQPLQQPNGGLLENCGVLHYKGYLDVENWNDVSCYYTVLSNYICEAPIVQNTLNKILVNVNSPTSHDAKKLNNIVFKCSGKNGFYISTMHVRDGEPDCTNSEDETHLNRYSNMVHKFNYLKCTKSEYISVVKYCDFSVNCLNSADDENCRYRKCVKDQEFMCKNKQCIESHKRCNGVRDCLDGSDEESCMECHQTAINCRIGTCIANNYQCDGLSIVLDVKVTKIV